MSIRIVAPVACLQDADEVLAAGADEIYCGAMFDEWVESYGDLDLLSRRQGRCAHVRTPDELAAIVRLAHEAGAAAALTVNARYSPEQEAAVLDLIRIWEDMAGDAVLVTDVGIMLALRSREARVKLHLSLLANVFNSATASFFADLGVSRLVLPRELTIQEMRSMTAAGPPIEYEAIAIGQKCQFIDGTCGFYHGVRFPDGVPAAFDYEMVPGASSPVVWSCDPEYEGHGCEVAWHTAEGPVTCLRRDDFSAPHCAACLLWELSAAGVGFAKIAGRGYPTSLVATFVRFLKESRHVLEGCQSPPGVARKAIRELYSRTFPGRCDESRCYYHLDDSGT